MKKPLAELVIYPAERARLLRHRADTLELLCTSLVSSSRLGRPLPPVRKTVGDFVNALIARCVTADGHRTGGELAVAAEYFRDGWGLGDNDEWVQEASHWDRAMTAMRPFLQAARAEDVRANTKLFDQMRLLIGDIAALLVTADGTTSAAEGQFVAELLTRLDQ